jgi:hypothetical protein
VGQNAPEWPRKVIIPFLLFYLNFPFTNLNLVFNFQFLLKFKVHGKFVFTFICSIPLNITFYLFLDLFYFASYFLSCFTYYFQFPKVHILG